MINICLVSDLSNGTQLAFKLLDLDYPEKEYQAVEIGLKGSEFIDVPIEGLDIFESGIAVIDGLTPEKVYQVGARAKHNDAWTNVPESAFITQIKRPNIHGTEKPCERFMGMIGGDF
ncbi:MAG: hypothetical protein Q8911_01245 [Bacillota bacterium]|nr:hypothetical protein [Bacillota bacterium]